MVSKLRQVIKRQEGQGAAILGVGLGAFILGVIFLLIWSRNMNNNGGWFLPGLILTAAGIILLSLGVRSGH